MKLVSKNSKLIGLLVSGIAISSPTFAEGAPVPSAIQNPLAQALILLMALLALAIGILSNVVNGAVAIYRDKLKAEREKENSPASAPVVMLIAGLLLSCSGIAQAKADAATATVNDSINGLSPITFYTLVGVLSVEIIIIITLIYQLKFLAGIERKTVAAAKGIAVESISIGIRVNKWWNKINKSYAIEKEKDIDLNHDYDGIRELDNSIPPWWLAAFIGCILFGAAYLYRYHVAKSAPLQIEEYTIAVQKAVEEQQAYLKLTAGNVDESTVKLLDETGIAAGQALFKANCVACHAADGGGLVGPNLTDNYWLHGGDIRDVFKTIKYGWPDKGMKSWKEDFSPVQIAQLASYVESLKGTKPATPKEPQGTLINTTDSTTKTTAALPAK
jgi:cytochrome c oxidase cbb3-type subunit 3